MQISLIHTRAASVVYIWFTHVLTGKTNYGRECTKLALTITKCVNMKTLADVDKVGSLVHAFVTVKLDHC